MLAPIKWLVPAAALLCLTGCKGPADHFQDRWQRGPVEVLEGLPSPESERALFERERERAGVERLDQDMHRRDYYFYEQRLSLPPEDLDKLGALLGDEALTLDEASACVFHPDYAVLWNGGEDKAMVCFGCRQIAFQSGTKISGGVLVHEKYLQLRALLSPYRQSRPERDP